MKIFRSAIQSIRQNKLRSVLTGFGIAWGIFLLVIFLGAGNGFKKGVMKTFNAFAQKSLFVYGGQTSVATAEMNEKTQILFNEKIIRDVRNRYGSIIACSPEMLIPSLSVSFEGEMTASPIKGVNQDYFKIKILQIKEGRSISELDGIRSRNIAVIGDGIAQLLFGKAGGIGKMIDIGGSLFKVIGILSSEDLFSMQERGSIYIPADAFIANFNSEGKTSSFCLSFSPEANSSAIEKDLHDYLAYRYGFDPHDEQAIYMANIETQTAAFENLFHGLEVLIWIIGICLLLSGIVGVCNMMLIVVKERTNEIGIRKAVGATSGSVISMILVESMTITFFAGAAGAVLGTLVVMLADKLLLPLLNTAIMDTLEINGPAVIAAFVILCLCGALAGLFPALKASRITPAEAIRYENRE